MEVQYQDLVHSSSLHDYSIDHVRNENLNILIVGKKYRLVLDLDNILLHSKETKDLTSCDQNYLQRYDCQRWLKDGKLYRWTQGSEWNGKYWVTKLRSSVQTFLLEANKLFYLSMLT